MNIFDSLTHSMTTIATGGFQIITSLLVILIVSNRNSSMIFIILGSLPFIAI